MPGNQRKVSRVLLEAVAYAWLCTEIGQFVQVHIRWGHNELFWPFWICFSLVLIMGAKLLDIYIRG